MQDKTDLTEIAFQGMKEGFKEWLSENIHIDVKTASDMINVSQSTLYEAVKLNKIKAVKIGKQKGIVFSIEAIQKYLAENSGERIGSN
jgi:excisionase family DNA binding protein